MKEDVLPVTSYLQAWAVPVTNWTKGNALRRDFALSVVQFSVWRRQEFSV